MMIPPRLIYPNSGGSSSDHHQQQQQQKQQNQVPQSLITSIYQTQICSSPTYLTLTWSQSLVSHSLTIHAPDSFSITISLTPSTFSSLFWSGRTGSGSKSIYLTTPNNSQQRIKLCWDFSRAQYTHNSAEPDSCFYIAVASNAGLEFFLGDLQDELAKRSGLAVMDLQLALLSRREHVFGRWSFMSRAHFLGSKREIGIDCSGGVLKVEVDGKTSLVIKRLAWKFRGHERIYIDGIEVEFFWDVFNWVNDNGPDCNSHSNNGGNRHGLFMFQVGEGGVWPEMVGPEKRLMKKSLSSLGLASAPSWSLSPSCSSVLQWAEDSSDGGRSSCSSSTRSCGSNGGFSLLLYAWRENN